MGRESRSNMATLLIVFAIVAIIVALVVDARLDRKDAEAKTAQRQRVAQEKMRQYVQKGTTVLSRTETQDGVIMVIQANTPDVLIGRESTKLCVIFVSRSGQSSMSCDDSDPYSGATLDIDD